MNISEIRRKNLRGLAGTSSSTEEFSNRIDRTPNQLSQIIGKTPTRNIGGRLARSIEEKLGIADGWMDQNHNSGTRAAPAWIPPFVKIEQIPEFISNPKSVFELTSDNLNMPDIAGSIAGSANSSICIWCVNDAHFLKDTLLVVDPDRPAVSGDGAVYYSPDTAEVVAGILVGIAGQWRLEFNNTKYQPINLTDTSLIRIGRLTGYINGMESPIQI
jgi:hypothetical protein